MRNKMKYRIKFVITFILLMCLQLINISCMDLYAFNDDIYTDSVEMITNDIEIKPIFESSIKNINTPIRVSFENSGVLSYIVETEGLSAVEIEIGTMVYDVTVTEEFGVLNVYATCEDGVLRKSSVYTFKYENFVYISDISEDQAWYDCMKSKLDNGEITQADFVNSYAELTKRYWGEYIPQEDILSEVMPPDNMTVVNGILDWEAENGKIAPLINSKVELIKLVNGNEIIIDTQYTAIDGSFNFEIPITEWTISGEDIFIRWRLESKTYILTNNTYAEYYYFNSDVRYNILPGETESFYGRIYLKPDTQHYRATYVHQAMTVSERFAIEMGMQIPNYINSNKTKLKVAYPIFILGETGFCIGDDNQSIAGIGNLSYSNIDLITHEYGHYVQYLMDIYGATLQEIIFNIPLHNELEDHFSDNWSKEYAMELTWSEAWADAFSTLAEHYYYNNETPQYRYFDKEYMLYIKWNGYSLDDPIYDNYNAFDHDGNNETPPKDNRGEAQELAVAAFIWDLYDKVNESLDKITLDYQDWWNLTTATGIYTLEDFVWHFSNVMPELRGDMGTILAQHNISPIITNISSYSFLNAPEITFTVNGSEMHPNNRFIVYFYDYEGEYLGETSMIESNVLHTDSVTYKVPNDVWRDVLNAAWSNCGDITIINVSVGGYRYDDNPYSNEIRKLSGPYFSPYYELQMIFTHELTYTNKNGSTHTLVCNGCGYEITEEHNYEYKMVDNYYHVLTCKCGSKSGENTPHALKGSTGTTNSKQCVFCNAWIYTGGSTIHPALPNKKPEEEIVPCFE